MVTEICCSGLCEKSKCSDQASGSLEHGKGLVVLVVRCVRPRPVVLRCILLQLYVQVMRKQLGPYMLYCGYVYSMTDPWCWYIC
jgi:hypothetical protein